MGKMMLLIPVSWVGSVMAFPHTIEVHVYNVAGAHAAIIANGEREATRVFERAGIYVRWTDCPRSDPKRGENQVCKESDEPSHFTVVIDEDFVHASIRDTALGFALPSLRGRNHAAVVYRELEAYADANADLIDRGSLLAAILAHEIGHLLLGSMRHGPGIMQANWTRAELKRIGQRRFLFTPEQAEALCNGLRSRSVPGQKAKVSNLTTASPLRVTLGSSWRSRLTFSTAIHPSADSRRRVR
jgi:hypothetical protein